MTTRKGPVGRSKDRGSDSSKTVAASSDTASKQHGIIRDPVHDLIYIDHPVVWKVLNTGAMQRLKRIKQLGLAYHVYPGADHSRFSHSLGVFHLSLRILDQLAANSNLDVGPEQKLVVQLAALLHDVGHGPFSHLFEAVLGEVWGGRADRTTKHDDWSKKIIMEDSELRSVLDNESPTLARDIKDVISNNYKPNYLCSVVSSQFDADRLDYMLRDSMMTGVQYGKFDLNWILRNLSLRSVTEFDVDREPHNAERIVIDARRGLSSLESYLLGNFYLYVHVYHHKTIQAAESNLLSILRCALDCAGKAKYRKHFHPIILKLAKGDTLFVNEYLRLDDSVVLSWIENWSEAAFDPTLKDLCDRFLSRNLFKSVPLRDYTWSKSIEIYNEKKEQLERNGLNPRYYLSLSDPSRVAYKNFFFLRRENKLDQEIYLIDHKGEVVRYSEISEDYKISRAVLEVRLDDNLLILPREIAAKSQ